MDPKRMIEQGYDRLAPHFEEWDSGSDAVLGWFLDELLQRLPAGADILELGCGSGAAAVMLSDGRSYTGVDLSGGQLAIARERLPDGTFLQADFTQLTFPDEAFDGVVSFFVFNHVPRAELAPTFSRVFRWLRPGGRFMLSLGAGDTDDEVQENWLGVPMFFASFDPPTNERLLRGAGFELELSETKTQIEEGEGEATFHWVIARKPENRP
ncbi:MAG: class I SAM-dependent methyltransferase [Actinomycetota bacterium]